MTRPPGGSAPLWHADAAAPDFPKLTKKEQADVCVVGAGIAGLTCAWYLRRAGRSVVVIDQGAVGGGETGRTSAHLSNALDDRYYHLERLHGAKGARLAAESHTAAIAAIGRVAADAGIDCDFEWVDGWLFVPPGDPDAPLEKEFEAATRAGIEGVELRDRAPLRGFETGRALRFPRQAQFHPMKYMAGLAAALAEMGVRIYTRSHAVNIGHENGAPYVETKNKKKISAGALVVACNTPVNDRVAIHTKQAAYRSYVIAAPVPAGSATRALFWDTAQPYHYARIQPGAGGEGRDMLILGGEDHKTGQADDAPARYARLDAWARDRFPGMGKTAYRWSGQIMEPVDSLAFIGRNPGDKDIYVATGDSGNGLTHGTIAGLLITDLILERENPWAALYDPGRVTLGSAGRYIGENANTAAQYADWFAPGDVKDEQAIAPGTGAIVRHGLGKRAVYRDEGGNFHRMTAVCPHLEGIVAWNNGEKSWDCPCHGSRFDKFGKVLNGPAVSDLKPAE